MRATLHSIVEDGKIIRTFSCLCDAEYYLWQMKAGDPSNPFEGDKEKELKFRKVQSDWYFDVENDYLNRPDIREGELQFYERMGFTRGEAEAWQRYMKFQVSDIHREIQTHPADL